MKTFTAFHNGCEPTAVDTSRVVSELKGLGLKFNKQSNDTDLIIFLGCTFTKDKEDEIYSLVEEHLQDCQNTTIIVSGCFLREVPMGERVVYLRTNEVADFVKREFLEDSLITTPEPVLDEENLIGNVTVSEGCFSNCSYCSIKQVRGHNRSVPLEKLQAQIRAIYSMGGDRIKLLGQEVCAYGMDIDTDLPTLVRTLWNEFPDLKIEYGSMNPKWLKRYSKDELQIFADERVRGNIHMPIQSASNRILKLMRRGYAVEEVEELYKRFRSLGVHQISTDIISGFPTETEEDHELTFSYMKEHSFNYAQIFAYDERPKTAAANLEQMPYSLRIARACDIISAYIESYLESKKLSYESVIKGDVEIPFNCNFSLNQPYQANETSKST